MEKAELKAGLEALLNELKSENRINGPVTAGELAVVLARVLDLDDAIDSLASKVAASNK